MGGHRKTGCISLGWWQQASEEGGVSWQHFLSAGPSILLGARAMNEISKPENLSLTEQSSQWEEIFNPVTFPLPFWAPRNLRGIENCIICSKNPNKDRKQWSLVTFSGRGPEDVYRKDSFLPSDLWSF